MKSTFSYILKSSLKHDYSRSRANPPPPSKSTGVHEAVMKQQQPISFYLDPVIWGDFQQPEPLTVLRALTSMQLPPRTVSFIMKGVKQSPHAAQHSTHTQVVRSDALRVTNDKHQSGRRRALAHSFSLSHLVTSTPPPHSVIIQRCSTGFIDCTNFLL